MIYKLEKLFCNETKERHQIAFLYRSGCSGSKVESLIVSIYLVFTFHFRREHVNRQISAFCADFRFRRKLECKQWKKSELTETIRLSAPWWSQKWHGFRVLHFWTRTLESICLSFCSSKYLCFWIRLPVLFKK